MTGAVVIGVAVHAEPARFAATRRTLHAHTSHGVRILAVPDRADPDITLALRRSAVVPEDGRPGGAAALNRLLWHADDAEVVVLLESGCLVGEHWLEPLLQALEDPGVGLAGPSTDRHWDRQQANGPGEGVEDLGPLYSIGDFCLAVHRRTVEAIGGADAGFGTLPGWEIEYATRAARAGLSVVWARASWVRRAPPTNRREREDADGFPAGRLRFQNRLCGRQLPGGEGGEYRDHCRGDACPNFAPRDRIALRVPLDIPASPRVPAPSPGGRAGAGHPLVSAIMPTRDRPAWVARSVGWFLAQEGVDAELVIVHEGTDDLEDILPDDPRVRLVRGPRGESVGAKRNRACEAARGSVIVQWDDDDWYAPDRLAVQSEPVTAGRADITGLTATHFLDLETGKVWAPTRDMHRSLFVADVHGGTLAYARALWQRGARYPDCSLAEDAELLRRAVRLGGRLERLDGSGRFAYIRHGANTWEIRGGVTVGRGPGWHPVPPPDNLDFSAFCLPGSATGPLPRVTAVMPTADRRPFVARALELFERQDHPDAELLVLDDGDDAVGDLIAPDATTIRYVRLDNRLVLGDKRNLGCELARGELVAHWDDDDWYAPDRLRRQAAALADTRADVAGQDRLLFVDVEARRAWRYAYPAGPRRWLAGTTLCYRRDAWRRHPFPSIGVGEDTLFVRSPGLRLHAHEEDLAVAFIHRGGSAPKDVTGHLWREEGLDAARGLLGDDAEAFLGAPVGA
jgi:glycosyltransferase involved in cell wall biosynthesis